MDCGRKSSEFGRRPERALARRLAWFLVSLDLLLPLLLKLFLVLAKTLQIYIVYIKFNFPCHFFFSHESFLSNVFCFIFLFFPG